MLGFVIGSIIMFVLFYTFKKCPPCPGYELTYNSLFFLLTFSRYSPFPHENMKVVGKARKENSQKKL